MTDPLNEVPQELDEERAETRMFPAIPDIRQGYGDRFGEVLKRMNHRPWWKRIFNS